MPFFEEVHTMLDNAKSLNESAAFVVSLDEEAKQLIINLNTTKQLGAQGIDAEGDDLGEYADFTIQEKERKGIGFGAITDHITFYDTGEYWKSWHVIVNDQFFEIRVDEARFQELVGDLGFSDTHVGLTAESMQQLTTHLLVKYQAYVINELKG